MKSKLCISPIISTILILVITILSVTSFLSWYSSYESNLNTKIESTVKQGNSIIIETIAGSVLYVKSNENTTIKSIKLDNNVCLLDLNLTAGINEIDISTCLNNLTRSNPSVSLVSDNQVLSKNIYIKTAIINTTSSQVPFSYNNCIFSGINISHNDNMTFYLQEFSGLGCVNEIRTCNNGVLSGSYNYTNCSTELALGGDYIEDFEIDGTNYRAHIFTQAGEHSFIVQTNNLEVDYLVVAGGGGGGLSGGRPGGGGAGGLLKGYNVTISNGLYSVIVGLGGNHSDNLSVKGEQGGNSSFNNIIAIGGGGGGSHHLGDITTGGNGGSGGGGATTPSSTSLGGRSVLGQGFDGSGGRMTYGGNYGGGGGGGAGSIGGIGTLAKAGDGGIGLVADIIPLNVAENRNIGEVYNNQVWFSGGGAGGGENVARGIGGTGGGGSGFLTGIADAENGTINTGGGGGGQGGDGGSGVVIIRYEID